MTTHTQKWCHNFQQRALKMHFLLSTGIYSYSHHHLNPKIQKSNTLKVDTSLDARQGSKLEFYAAK